MRAQLTLLTLVLAGCSDGALPAPGPTTLPATPVVPTPLIPTTPVVPRLPDGPYDGHVASADVSILFPIDAATDRDRLLSASEVGNHGALLGDAVSRVMPTALDSAAGSFADLRLVGLRLDGCSAHGGCGSEVRVVWQPVVTTQMGTNVADGAVHAMYALPAEELLTMVRQILTLKAAYGGAVTYPDALGVHPILAATGLTGPFAEGLHTIVREHLGADRITRATFMTHDGTEGDSWTFLRFERTDGDFVATDIIGAGTSQQTVSGSSALVDALGVVYAATPTVPALADIVGGGRPQAVDAAVQAGFAASIDTQHPLRRSSEDTDCVSCHVAEGARTIGHSEYGLPDVGLFTSVRGLGYVRQTKPVTNLHAFGYLGTAISIMQRTANETALAADRVEAALASP